MNKKILYVLNNFSKRTTFILNELLALQEKLEVDVCACRETPKEEANAPFASFRGKIFCLFAILKDAPFSLIASNVLVFLKHPLISAKYFKKCLYYAIKLRRPAYFSVYFFANCLHDIIKRNNYNHIHCHFIDFYSLAVMQVSELLNIPFSVTIHAYEIFIQHPDSYFDLVNETLLKASKIAVISEYNKKYISEHINPELVDKIKVIHCGLNVTEKPGEYKPVREKLRILSIAVLKQKKGLSVLIKALSLLDDMSWELTIVGDGPEKSHLVSLVNESGLQNKVHFVDYLDNDSIPNFMKDFDVFILPCVRADDGDQDGIPVVLMEAMSVGLPVISTNLSGIPELITENPKTGFLAEPDDPVGLAETIRTFYNLADENKKAIINNAYNKILTDFNVTIEVDKLYSELIM